MRVFADRPQSARVAAAIAAAVFSCPVTRAAAVTLPVEVVGENGATASVTFEVPPGRASEPRSLWMQIHGLGYRDMVSVQINSSDWLPLNNDTVAVAEPGKSYGGIGGGFSTLKMTLPLPSRAVVEGANTLRFRFNHSNGVVSGFRVLAFNLLAGDSRPVLDHRLVHSGRPQCVDAAVARFRFDTCREGAVGGGAALAGRLQGLSVDPRELFRLPCARRPRSQILLLLQCVHRRQVPLSRPLRT